MYKVYMRFIPFILFALCILGCQESQTVEENQEATAYRVAIMVNEQALGDIDIHSFNEADYREVTSGDMIRHGLSISQIIQKSVNVPQETLEDYLAGYMCDYESTDGFRASSQGDRCPIVSCSLTIHSYIDTQTHQLFYEDDQPMSKLGCYNVKNLKKVLMYPAELEN